MQRKTKACRATIRFKKDKSVKKPIFLGNSFKIFPQFFSLNHKVTICLLERSRNFVSKQVAATYYASIFLDSVCLFIRWSHFSGRKFSRQRLKSHSIKAPQRYEVFRLAVKMSSHQVTLLRTFSNQDTVPPNNGLLFESTAPSNNVLFDGTVLPNNGNLILILPFQQLIMVSYDTETSYVRNYVCVQPLSPFFSVFILLICKKIELCHPIYSERQVPETLNHFPTL